MGIKVCIGNYGYYNEGELHDAWIELPVTQKEFDDFLKEHRLQDPMHEEIYISDYDGTPFGIGYGGIFSEYTSVEDLNLLAKAMEEAEYSDEDYEDKVTGALACGMGEPKNIAELINLIAQADEIPYVEYKYQPGAYDSPGINSEEAAWAETELEALGGVEGLERETLERYLDTEAYGRDMRITDVVAGDEGWCWEDSQEGPDLDELAEAAEELAEEAEDNPEVEVAPWRAAALEESMIEPEEVDGIKVEYITRDGQSAGGTIGEMSRQEVREALRRLVGHPFADDEPATAEEAADEKALLAIVAGMSDFEREAVSTYVDRSVSYATTDQFATACVRVDEIDYRDYNSNATDLDKRVGETLVNNYGVDSVSRKDLEMYFDAESWGRDCSMGGNITLGPSGYLYGDMPDMSLWSMEKLQDMYLEPGDLGNPEELDDDELEDGLEALAAEKTAEAQMQATAEKETAREMEGR